MRVFLSLTPAIPLLLIGGVAFALGHRFPLIGAPVAAIILGTLIAPWAHGQPWHAPLKPLAHRLLLYAIVFLGFGMDFAQVLKTGSSALILMLITISSTVLLAIWLGPRLGLDRHLSLLIGAGTSICGGSAVVALSRTLRAKDETVVQAISIIFLYNIAAAILFPVLGHHLGLDAHAFGLWAGTAINDTSSVLAASFSYGDVSGRLATVVKLTRTLMIIPLAILYTGLERKNQPQSIAWQALVPWPLLGFLIATVVRIPLAHEIPGILPGLHFMSQILLVGALAGIGLQIHLGKILRESRAAIFLGGILWICLSILSLGLIYWMH
ncbi:MAG TPA: putative sulfate exporter family transporter [Fibrobacteraceae bacterium]|nr:putative sulfate exporter family transporter [Fibrobacteraceae bacterium]